MRNMEYVTDSLYNDAFDKQAPSGFMSFNIFTQYNLFISSVCVCVCLLINILIYKYLQQLNC